MVNNYLHNRVNYTNRILICSMVMVLPFISRTQNLGIETRITGETRHNLPLVVIETSGKTIVDEPKISVNLKVIDNGSGKTNGISDPAAQYDGAAGIELRGQSTMALFPKKSYGFETRDKTGNDLKVSLLGLPEESDWILYAPYSDKTMLRNALTFFLGRRMGRWQPGYRYCELYLNGSYMGVYQLTEKIKRDKNRLDIAKLTSSDLSGDAVTGGYIVKVDKVDGIPSTDYFLNTPDIRFNNARLITWTYVYPESNDLASQQRTWLKSYIKTVENVINGASFADASSGYRKYLDAASFIDFQIMNELSNNVDGYRYSTFFHKDKDSKGGRLIAGPLWDFDICYGNVNYSASNLAVDQWQYLKYGPSSSSAMHWWARLMMDSGYSHEVMERWTQWRKSFLQTDSVFTFIDSQVALLGESIDRNYAKWNILGSYVWPNSAVRYTYIAEIDFLKDWIKRRMDWLDSQWLLPTGVADAGKNKLHVWPNPVSRVLNITPGQAGDCTLRIFDTMGKKILELQPAPEKQGNIQINLSNLPGGTYVLQLIHPHTSAESVLFVKY